MEKTNTINRPYLSSTAARAVQIGLFALATAAAAQIHVPLPGTVVPLTLQTFVVLLAGLHLGSRDGALSQILYVGGGAAGLPFFAGGGATGLAVLAGPTGGYLIGFMLTAFFLGRMNALRGGFIRTWALTFFASILLFVPGVIQLKLWMGLTWTQAFAMGVVPFVVGDLLKVTMAASTARLLRSARS